MTPGSGNDDAGMFRRAMGDVTPLRRKRTQPEPPAAESEPPPPEKPPAAKRAPPPPPPPLPPLPEITAGSHAGIDRATADRLRRGRMPIDARLDLHGHTQASARDALAAFIAKSAASGCRVVLVITGRGSRGGKSVLRANLPEWLNQPPCREHLLGFAPARPQHGGEGAFYALLRRKRKGRP